MLRKSCFLLVLLMTVCMLCACGATTAKPAEVESADAASPTLDPNTLEGQLVGEWLVETASAEGTVVSTKQYGLRVTLTLNPDGSAVMDYNGEIDDSMSWRVADGKAYLTGYTPNAEVEITVREDGLIISDELGTMYLARESK